MTTPDRTPPPSPAEIPWDGLPELAITAIVVPLVLLALGGFLLFDVAHDRASSVGAHPSIGELVGGLVSVALAGVTVLGRGGALYYLRWKQRMRDRPGEVVWIYDTIRHVNGEIERKLHVGFTDRRILIWPLERPLVEQPRIRTWIAEHAPHATIGYSDARVQQFNADPRSLVLSSKAKP